MFGFNKQQFILFLALGIIIVALAFYSFKNDNSRTVIESEEAFNVIHSQSEVDKPVESEQEKEPLTEEVMVDEFQDIDVTIYVTGCVNSPGVYTLKKGSRLSDALELAGGATKEANLLGVNLALIVKDEGMYVVPKQGEELPVIVENTNGIEENRTAKININTALQNELEQLSGIGPVKAAAIINYRESNGPFKKISEITSVTGIGDKTFESLQDEICIK